MAAVMQVKDLIRHFLTPLGPLQSGELCLGHIVTILALALSSFDGKVLFLSVDSK
jgi:hypothetical protein